MKRHLRHRTLRSGRPAIQPALATRRPSMRQTLPMIKRSPAEIP
jgi:hypothetical protein